MIKVHLHSNFPLLTSTPNPAIGYLKGFLSQTTDAEVTNYYWYLLPKQILNPILYIGDRAVIVRTMVTILLSNILNQESFYKHETRITPLQSLLYSYVDGDDLHDIALLLKDYIIKRIKEKRLADARVAGFTVKMHQHLFNRYIWRMLKKENPNIKILIGGLYSESQAETFMRVFPEVDYAIWGEGEYPMKYFIEGIDDNSSNLSIPRLIYRHQNKLVISRICDKPEKDIYAFADHSEYFEQLKENDLLDTITPFIPIVGTKGCRWHKCKFCVVHGMDKYRQRSVVDIVKEVEFQSKKYGIDKIAFVDTDIGRRTSKEFRELILAFEDSACRRERPYEMDAEICPIRLTRENIDIMKRIKFIGVQIGFEAMTDGLLKGMDKMHRFAENLQSLKFAKDVGFDVAVNVLRNLACEQAEDVTESIVNLKYLRFILKSFRFILQDLELYRGAVFYDEIPENIRRTVWVFDETFEEFNRQLHISEEDRWEFSGFKSGLRNSRLWEIFEKVLNNYSKTDISYDWVEFPNGKSLVVEDNELTETSKRFELTELETKLVIFCDEIRTFDEICNKFKITTKKNREILNQLSKEALVYVDNERQKVISVLSTRRIMKLKG